MVMYDHRIWKEFLYMYLSNSDKKRTQKVSKERKKKQQHRNNNLMYNGK